MYELPTSIEINGVQYQISQDGDYRMILDAFVVLNDGELNEQERLFCALIVFYEDINCIEDILKLGQDVEELVKQMFNFFNAGRPESSGPNRKLIDWEGDSAMIVSAINKVAGKEVRAEKYMHWWTFIGYYSAIGESTLSTVVSIRDKILSGKKLEKWENQFKRDNMQYFNWDHRTAQDKEAEEWLKSVWNKE